VTLNPPTCPPTETAVTPSLDDYVLAFADEDDVNAPTLNPPQAPLLTLHGQPQHPQIARPVSKPLAPTTNQTTLQADGASAEPLAAHDATERNTKKPRLRNAETAQIRHVLPEDWVSKSRGAKNIGCNHISEIGGAPQSPPFGAADQGSPPI
jgi:hypothetical protein